MALPPELEAKFPGLAEAYEQTSSADPSYNCIGFAAGDNDVWWEPVLGAYWPRRIPREYSLAALQAAFATIGYRLCASGDLEVGVEKIAIYANEAGTYEHAARQLEDGFWTSKIGRNEDIRHGLLQLEGKEYGKVVAFMSRPRR
jgi:hypothetical protein